MGFNNQRYSEGGTGCLGVEIINIDIDYWA